MLNITTLRHPRYLRDQSTWEQWRDTFEGGENYRDRYLKKFSDRETDADFLIRRELTPITTFAKSAILDVRNSIYQRLVGVSRVGGSKAYQDAVAGLGGGVDGEGSTMDGFIGNDVLTELLTMGKVGVYVDAAPPTGPTMADQSFPPYLTYYKVEDILTYQRAPRGLGGEFQAVLLRDWSNTTSVDLGGISLPNGSETRYRLVWKDENGLVWYKLFDGEGKLRLTPNSYEDGAVLTDLKRVPFVLFDIGESLLKDVSSYQSALLNLASNDVFYAIKSNSPFLVIQKDRYASGDHLKKPESDTTSGASENVGAGKGRYYGINEEAPQFIAPPTDTLEASMKLQERLEDSIRRLINLAVESKAGSRTESAASKKIGQGGLEAGLSFIGQEMEDGERRISTIWAEFEDTKNPVPATVSYPERYTLKDDEERLAEADKQIELVNKLPGQKLKREVAKMIVATLLGGKIPAKEFDSIIAEINSADYILADPATVMEAHKEGLVDDITASQALGFASKTVVPQARKDRAERIALTLEAQTPKDEQGNAMPPAAPGGAKNPASRGVPELDTNPQSGRDEKVKE